MKRIGTKWIHTFTGSSISDLNGSDRETDSPLQMAITRIGYVIDATDWTTIGTDRRAVVLTPHTMRLQVMV